MAFSYNNPFKINFLELFDKDSKSLGKVGSTKETHNKYTIEIKEGERIIGIAANDNR